MWGIRLLDRSLLEEDRLVRELLSDRLIELNGFLSGLRRQ